MPLSNSQLILCRPQSGLNDFLCEIERCCRYADHHNRYVLVDSAYKHARTFHDSFARYFISTSDKLVLNGEVYASLLDGADVYPPALRGRVNTYASLLLRIAGSSEGQRRFIAVDRESRQPLTFDFRKSYTEKLLVHQQPFGGEVSLYALERMRLHDEVVDGLIARLRQFDGPYVGVHIRHTDYQTDYTKVIRHLEGQSFKQLFLATDSVQVREEFRGKFGEKLKTFSALPDVEGTPLHMTTKTSKPVDRHQINLDSVLDLVTLALASTLIIAKTTSGKFSGYSLLAKNLNKRRDILRHMMGRKDVFLEHWLTRAGGSAAA